MLELVKNIEFIKNKNLRVEKINDKEFFLENEKEKFILNLSLIHIYRSNFAWL